MMKLIVCILAMVTASLPALSASGIEADQLKKDLVGHCMGGREKCWKFQSVDQIRSLKIKSVTEYGPARVYVVELELQAAGVAGKYKAEARVECAKAGAAWKVKQVGLFSLEQMK
ncbi:MAG: hypothetical protein AB1705_10300 [Verrucomicrobiota bacterium]